MAIDQDIAQRVDAYRGNPQALQQRYAANQELLDLLALQRLKSEKDDAMRKVQLEMQQDPQTIKQQKERQLLEMTKQDLVKQTTGIMQNAQKKQQKNMQRVAKQGAANPQQVQKMQAGLGALAQRQQQQGQAPMRMAAGGIVAFRDGGGVDEVTQDEIDAYRAQMKESPEYKRAEELSKWNVRHPISMSDDQIRDAILLERKTAETVSVNPNNGTRRPVSDADKDLTNEKSKTTLEGIITREEFQKLSEKDQNRYLQTMQDRANAVLGTKALLVPPAWIYDKAVLNPLKGIAELTGRGLRAAGMPADWELPYEGGKFNEGTEWALGNLEAPSAEDIETYLTSDDEPPVDVGDGSIVGNNVPPAVGNNVPPAVGNNVPPAVGNNLPPPNVGDGSIVKDDVGSGLAAMLKENKLTAPTIDMTGINANQAGQDILTGAGIGAQDPDKARIAARDDTAKFLGRDEKRGKMDEYLEQLKAMDVRQQDPKKLRDREISAFLRNTAGVGSFGQTMASGSQGMANERAAQEQSSRDRLLKRLDIAKNAMDMDMDIAKSATISGDNALTQAMENRRTIATVLSQTRGQEVQLALDQANLDYNADKDNVASILEALNIEYTQALRKDIADADRGLRAGEMLRKLQSDRFKLLTDKIDNNLTLRKLDIAISDPATTPEEAVELEKTRGEVYRMIQLELTQQFNNAGLLATEEALMRIVRGGDGPMPELSDEFTLSDAGKAALDANTP